MIDVFLSAMPLWVWAVIVVLIIAFVIYWFAIRKKSKFQDIDEDDMDEDEEFGEYDEEFEGGEREKMMNKI